MKSCAVSAKIRLKLGSGVALFFLAFAPGAFAGTTQGNDPVNSAISNCVSLSPVVAVCPTSYSASGTTSTPDNCSNPPGGTSSSGTGTGGSSSSCRINGCISSAALNITTWLPWFCDRGGATSAFPGEGWLSCARWFFTGRWQGLASQATASSNPTKSSRDCRQFNTAVATAYAEIHDEWTCLSGAFRGQGQGIGSRATILSMQRDVEFLLNSLSSDAGACGSKGSNGTSSSGNGTTPPSVITFGQGPGSGTPPGGSSSSGALANNTAINLIGFDTGSPTLNAALAEGVDGPISGCSYTGTGAGCDRKAYDEFQSFCEGNENCVFPKVFPSSQAAYDLGLGSSPPQPGAKGNPGKPITVYGRPYVYCSLLGYWEQGTVCTAPASGQ